MTTVTKTAVTKVMHETDIDEGGDDVDADAFFSNTLMKSVESPLRWRTKRHNVTPATTCT